MEVGNRKRKNYRKDQKSKRLFRLLSRIILGFKVAATVAAVAAATGFFILIHEIVTQCDYFAAENVAIAIPRATR